MNNKFIHVQSFAYHHGFNAKNYICSFACSIISNKQHFNDIYTHCSIHMSLYENDLHKVSMDFWVRYTYRAIRYPCSVDSYPWNTHNCVCPHYPCVTTYPPLILHFFKKRSFTHTWYINEHSYPYIPCETMDSPNHTIWCHILDMLMTYPWTSIS